MNLKDGWNASNHNLNYLPQVITSQRRILGFDIRELYRQALATRWESSTAPCNVLRSSVVQVAPLSSQSYTKPKFIGLQIHHDGEHSNAVIKDFRALLDNVQDSAYRMALLSGTQEFIKHRSHNKLSISDEQMHTMELCI